MKVTANFEISDERISDLLCSAFEGGSNYWYFIREVNYPQGKTKADFKYWHMEVPLSEGGSLIIDYIEGDEDLSGKILNRESIQKGLKLMAEKFPKHYYDFITENDDADTGDVFLQLCLYEDVIFG